MTFFRLICLATIWVFGSQPMLADKLDVLQAYSCSGKTIVRTQDPRYTTLHRFWTYNQSTEVLQPLEFVKVRRGQAEQWEVAGSSELSGGVLVIRPALGGLAVWHPRLEHLPEGVEEFGIQFGSKVQFFNHDRHVFATLRTALKSDLATFAPHNDWQILHVLKAKEDSTRPTLSIARSRVGAELTDILIAGNQTYPVREYSGRHGSGYESDLWNVSFQRSAGVAVVYYPGGRMAEGELEYYSVVEGSPNRFRIVEPNQFTCENEMNR